jgi:hypothetical protein
MPNFITASFLFSPGNLRDLLQLRFSLGLINLLLLRLLRLLVTHELVTNQGATNESHRPADKRANPGRAKMNHCRPIERETEKP